MAPLDFFLENFEFHNYQNFFTKGIQDNSRKICYFLSTNAELGIILSAYILYLVQYYLR